MSSPPVTRPCYTKNNSSVARNIIKKRSDKSEPTQTDPLVWPRRDVSSAFLDVLTQPSIQGQQEVCPYMLHVLYVATERRALSQLLLHHA